LLLAAWLGGLKLFLFAALASLVLVVSAALAWPLRRVVQRKDEVCFSRPSKFYSGNP